MQEVLLSSICDLKNGFAFKSKDYVDSSNTLSCRMSSIRPGGNFDLEHNQRFLSDTYAEVYSDYLLNDGDIVIAMTDLAGDPKILGVPTIVNTGGKKLLQNQRVGKLVITDSSKVFIPYLQYALNRPSNKSYYKKFAGGGLQINVSKKDILNNSVPLPPLNQQKKIAAILDAADVYRQKTKALITKYDELTQSLFLDMFGDIRINENNYIEETLLNACDYITDGAHLTPKLLDKGYPFMTVANMTEYGYKYDRCKRISEVDYLDLVRNNCQPKVGDILFSKDGTVGKVLRIREHENIVLLSSIAILRFNKKYNPIYVEYYLKSDFFLFQATSRKSGSAIRRIVLKDIKKTKIALPSIEFQNQFAERVQAIEAQKVQAQASLAQAEDLFNSLLQRAFKGELVS